MAKMRKSNKKVNMGDVSTYKMSRIRQVSVRLSESEYERLTVLAKHRNMSISDYVRDMALNDGCSLVQLRIMLTDIDNTLSNILLAEKIIAANETEMFRNVSTRITVGDRNPAEITPEEGQKINNSIANSIKLVKTAAMDAVVKHYTDPKAHDPLHLNVFAEKLEELKKVDLVIASEML